MIRGFKTRISNMIRNIFIVFGDNERKSLIKILKEFIIASFRSKSIATYYFTSFLYKTHITNYLDFISHKEWQYMQRTICDSMTYAILGDKLYFHEYFSHFNIPMPKLLAFNIREKLILYDITNSTKEILNLSTLAKILSNLTEKSTNGNIFLKPIISSGGHGIIKISSTDCNKPNSKFDSLYKALILDAYIFQEEVVQHKDIAALNPTSLNTIRIDTFKAYGKEPQVLSAYLRIGGKDGFVDNITSGGSRVGINFETSSLNKFGTSKIYHGAKFTTHHPGTAIEFENYKIPYLEDVKVLAIKAATCLPQSLVGWDIAISEEGPILIEGNTVYYSMDSNDIAYGGYRNNPIYRKVVDYVRNELELYRK